MELALEQARLAANLNETPIGAVLVWEGEVVASAFNRRELDRIATAHAEILAINEACRKLGGTGSGGKRRGRCRLHGRQSLWRTPVCQ